MRSASARQNASRLSIERRWKSRVFCMRVSVDGRALRKRASSASNGVFWPLKLAPGLPCELGNSPCAAAPQCRSFARIAATSITIRGARRLAQAGMQRYFTAAHDKPYRGQPGRRAWLLALCLALGGCAAPELRPVTDPGILDAQDLAAASASADPIGALVTRKLTRQQQAANEPLISAALDQLGVPYRYGGSS